MIPQTEQRRPRDPPLQRRRNTESDALCRRVHVRVAAEHSTERTVAGPDCHRACLQFGDMLRYGCTEAQGAHTGELPVGSLQEERERGC